MLAADLRISRGAEQSIIVSCILSMKIATKDRHLTAKGVFATHLQLAHSADLWQSRTLSPLSHGTCNLDLNPDWNPDYH